MQWATAQQTLLKATLEYRNYNPARASVMNDPRVQEIMGAWGAGSYLKIVANNLRVSEETVKTHMRSILSKLGANDRTHAVTIALKRGIIDIQAVSSLRRDAYHS